MQTPLAFQHHSLQEAEAARREESTSEGSQHIGPPRDARSSRNEREHRHTPQRSIKRPRIGRNGRSHVHFEQDDIAPCMGSARLKDHSEW